MNVPKKSGEKGKKIMHKLRTSECWQAEKDQYEWHELSVQKTELRKRKDVKQTATAAMRKAVFLSERGTK